LTKNLDRLRNLILLGEDQSLLEASLSVARILREIPIDSLEGLSVLALLQEVIDILKLVRARGRRGEYQREKQDH